MVQGGDGREEADRNSAVLLDVDEADRWWRTAAAHRRSCAVVKDAGEHPAAVLLAEQAAQCSLKGLLHGVGRGDLARGHSSSRLAAACREHAGLPEDERLDDRLVRLAREYEASRYPDALPEGVAPPDFYIERDAAEALGTAEAVGGRVHEAWQTLVAIARSSDDPEGDA